MTESDFYKYTLNAISDSISALDTVSDIINYYGNSDECTIESYFSNQICNGNIYDAICFYENEFLIGKVDDYRSIFELARQEAFYNWENKI